MGYSDTQSFNLTAAGTTGPDVINALIAHFTAAPGRWELKSGVSPVAGAALTIRRKTTPLEVGDINYRWDSAGGYFWGAIDPDGAITASGDGTTAPTMSSNASPEARTDALGSINAAILVHEHDDCVTVLIQNSAKTLFLHGFHQGIGYSPLRANDSALGLTGHCNLVGRPSAGAPNVSSNWWFTSGTTTAANQSRLRGWNAGAAAAWFQASLEQTGVVSSGDQVSPISSDGLIKSARPLTIRANEVNGSNDLAVGLSKWTAAAPFNSSTFPAQLPRTIVADSVLDEAWMYAKEVATNTCFVVSCEKGFVPA